MLKYMGRDRKGRTGDTAASHCIAAAMFFFQHTDANACETDAVDEIGKGIVVRGFKTPSRAWRRGGDGEPFTVEVKE